MKNIEVEARALVTEKEYNNLFKKLKKETKYLKEIRDETIYFNEEGNVRLRRDDEQSYLIIKAGKLHARYREEKEFVFPKKEFGRLKEVVEELGHKPAYMWQRKRKIFSWGNTKICLDDTKDYDRILELEELTDAKGKHKAYETLKEKMKKLGFAPASEKKMRQKFNEYKRKWKKGKIKLNTK